MTLGSFDQFAFDHDLNEFQHNLGELKALEMVEESFYQWVSGENSLVNVGAEYYWDVPSRNHPFQFVFITTLFPQYEAQWRGIVADCWSEGANWAAGVAGNFKELTQRWTEPDAGEIMDAARLLDAKVATDLPALFDDDWSVNANRGTSLARAMEHWDGRAATSFTIFYSNVDNKASRWAQIASRCAGFWAAHAVVLDAGQQAMMEIISKAKDHTDKQLENWAASHKSWPYGSTPGAFTAAQVLEVISIGATVASLIPPLAPVAGPVRTVTGLAQKIEASAGSGSSSRTNVDFDAARAFEIYQDVYDKMNLKAVVATTSAMINLRSGESDSAGSGTSAGTGDVAGDAAGNDFFAPRLSGIDDPQPGDWDYSD